MKVSIIVPSRNSLMTIGRMMDSVRKQTYHNIELVVVDSGSIDGTAQLALKRADRFVHVGPLVERSEAVNLAAKISTGDVIWRADADIVFQPDAIAKGMEMFTNGYDALATLWDPDTTMSYWAKVRKLEKDCYTDDPAHLATGVFTREAFFSVGGFDQSLVAGEDYDIDRRLRARGCRIGIMLVPRAIHIGEPMTLAEVVRHNIYYGKTLKFNQKGHRADMGQLGPLRYSWVRHWKDFVRQPILLPGFIAYQFTRYVSAGIGFVNGK